MLSLLLKQPLNIWQTLELRHKIEALLLFVLIYAFTATRLNTLFANWVSDGATDIGITLLLSNFFTLLLTISSVLLIRWFIPRQKAVNILISRPLDRQQTISVLTFYAFKYLSLYCILLIPVATALFSSFGIYASLLSLLTVFSVSYAFLLLFFQLKNTWKKGSAFIISGLLISLAYHGLFATLYWTTSYAYLFQLIVLAASLILIFYLYKFNKTDLHLENFLGYKKKEISRPQISKLKDFRIAQLFPTKIQALFEKEIFCLWRNSYYRKLKIQSYVIFVLLSLLIIIAQIEHKEIWLAIINCLVIWLHYSNSFNEKYVVADPEWFIRSLPIRFRHLFLAKYFAEIAFVVLLVINDVLFLQFTASSLLVQSYTLLFILTFAHLVLFTMLNFQIMFYDNTRLAAYAYHFALIFIVIMILNYRLVGPLIAVCLLIFFLYKNVKYFNN